METIKFYDPEDFQRRCDELEPFILIGTRGLNEVHLISFPHVNFSGVTDEAITKLTELLARFLRDARAKSLECLVDSDKQKAN